MRDEIRLHAMTLGLWSMKAHMMWSEGHDGGGSSVDGGVLAFGAVDLLALSRQSRRP